MNYDYLSAPPSHSLPLTGLITRPSGRRYRPGTLDTQTLPLISSTWILSILGDSAAGFRFDAIKYIDEDFIVAFIKHVRQKAGQPNLSPLESFGVILLGSFDT